MERILYLFYIGHVKEELPSTTKEHDERSRQQWEWVEQQIKKLPPPNRAYFDSLDQISYPGRMKHLQEWKRDFAPVRTLTPENQMMLRLIRKNVIIEPTEDRSLMEEYDRICRAFSTSPKKRNLDLFLEMIDRRDQFIAECVNKTLRNRETGFLFQGSNHDIQRFLEADIKLGIYLGNLKAIQQINHAD